MYTHIFFNYSQALWIVMIIIVVTDEIKIFKDNIYKNTLVVAVVAPFAAVVSIGTSGDTADGWVPAFAACTVPLLSNPLLLPFFSIAMPNKPRSLALSTCTVNTGFLGNTPFGIRRT